MKRYDVTQRWAIFFYFADPKCRRGRLWRTHMRQQVKQSVSAERSHRQGHEEGEQELEAGLFEDGNENDTQQRQKADDGDGHEAPDPDPHCRERRRKDESYLLVCFITRCRMTFQLRRSMRKTCCYDFSQ